MIDTFPAAHITTPYIQTSKSDDRGFDLCLPSVKHFDSREASEFRPVSNVS